MSAWVLSFVPFTARQANNALVGSCLTSIACLIRLMRNGDRVGLNEHSQKEVLGTIGCSTELAKKISHGFYSSYLGSIHVL